MTHPLVYPQAQSIADSQDTAMLVFLDLLEGCKTWCNFQVLLKKIHRGFVGINYVLQGGNLMADQTQFVWKKLAGGWS